MIIKGAFVRPAYPVETDIPAPARDRRANIDYAAMPLKSIKVGGSFFVPESDCGERSIHSVAAVIRTKAKRLGIAIRTEVKRPDKKTGKDGLRIWRVDPLELWPEDGSRHEPPI